MSEVPFTIAIPTYNRAGMIGAAIESALGQTHPDFELLVLDNASEDETAQVCARFRDPRMRVVRNERTVSMYANHNLCVANARSPWIVFLHSDDRLRPHALGHLKRRIEARSCDVVYPVKALHRRHLAAGDLVYSGRASIPSLLRSPAGTPSGAAYRRSLLARMPFDEKRVVSDFALLADALLEGACIVISGDDTVDIGEGAFQYSRQWHASGDFIVELADEFGRVVRVPSVLESVEAEIGTWSDSEIAFLLMMLSHAGDGRAIARLQARLGEKRGYKRSANYRHVVLYKVVGRTGLRLLFRAAKVLRAGLS